MKKRVGVLMVVFAICMPLASLSTGAFAQARDEKMQGQDQKMSGDSDKTGVAKMSEKKNRKHSKDKMGKMDKMDEKGKMDEEVK